VKRAEEWARLRPSYDLLVVGGGITGAGIALEAARAGLAVLLVEQGDFASGTSSRSSKLVHGGLRYLAEGNLKLTWEAVRERDRLLAEAPGLVDPIGFLFALHRGDRPGRAFVGTGLVLYDLLAREGRHARLDREEFLLRAPHAGAPGLEGGFAYADAATDDARLVLRVLHEAEAAGATALNYVRCEGLLRGNGTVAGAVLRDLVTGGERDVRATAVVNATGAWADQAPWRGGGKAPDPTPARQPPPLPGVAIPGGAGRDVPPPGRRPPALRLPLGRAHPPRDDRPRPPGPARRGAGDRGGGSGLPPRRRPGRVSLPRALGEGRGVELRGGEARRRDRKGEALRGEPRPRPLGGVGAPDGDRR
jgi:glycerol-3-phosphate dehydrogenase